MYVCRYYNSMYDKPQYAGLEYPASLNESEKYNYVGKLAEHIRNLSTAVAKTVYSYLNVTDDVPVECAADSTTVIKLAC
jgi:Nicastrin